MAKTKRTKPKKSAGKLNGKTVAFVGDLGYYKHPPMFAAAVIEASGTVVEADSAVPDYLVVGQGRGGKTPGQATALLKKHPAIQALDVQAFCNLLLPTRVELAEQIRSGFMSECHHGSEHDTHWDMLETMLRLGNSTIDLSGESFRGANLYGAHLEAVKLDAVDLSETNLKYAHLPALRGVRMNKAKMECVYLNGAEDCSFRDAQMIEAWFYDVHHSGRVCRYFNNDFAGAKLTKARADRTNAAGSSFRNADLSDGAFEHSDFIGADLSGANLTQIHLHKANLTDAKLGGANCQRADLRDAQLVNADLRKANLRGVVLTGANLIGAKLDGADFAGANLAGAKLDRVDTSRAKNLIVQQARTAGPKMTELRKVAAQSRSLESSVEIDLGNGERAVLHASGRSNGGKFYHDALSSFLTVDAKWGENERHDASTFEQGMLNAAERWSRGSICLDTVTAKGSKCPLKGKPLLELAAAAWSEACGVDAADLAKKTSTDATARESLQEAMLAELKGGAAGIKKWNARPKHERTKIAKLRPLDLSLCNLSGADFEDCDLSGASLNGANLKKAILQYGRWDKTNFAGADMRGATLASGETRGASFENATMTGCEISGLTMRNANFRGVDLSNMALEFIDLRGADLSTAKLNGTTFQSVSFDDKTQFPKGFVPPESMEWRGPGPHPALAAKAPRAKKAGAMTFDDFLKALANNVHVAKMQKAKSMLKAERFQLFAEVKDESLAGIVRSQTDKELVYSCRLASDGSFSCCTQNLKPCGGLQGSLCKHLLVLIVGLTKAEKLDPATVDSWIIASIQRKPAIDKDQASDTFIRFKGAEAGDVDWRPTETIPEDFYAM